MQLLSAVMALGTGAMKARSIFAMVSGRVAYNFWRGARRVSTRNHDVAFAEVSV